MIELLAPAKDKKCAKAAIDFGADAIYIGASEFGARKNVPNSLSDIKEIVDYAHKFNVKVYVTINTILSNEEILRAKKLIFELNKIGTDAIIIQDMGLLKLDLPEISLHASTQCDNRTVEKVKFLENVGFERVILARELSLGQIKEIKKQTNIELEAFIHGALCVSYSGQCYLSQMIGGRSANRGECAQPCRKRYSLIDENGNYIAKNQHLLNLKDFNASKYLKELAQAGVTSFKIEGRLKDEAYVKNVVGYYRKLIDSLGMKKTSAGKIIFDFEPSLEKTFNRGFTDYFLNNRHACYNFLTPKSTGEYVGKVVKINKNSFEVSSSDSRNNLLSAQDGLCFYSKGELSGCLVNKIEGQNIYPNKMEGIKAGTEIYRNFDSEFEKKLKNSKTCRKIEAKIDFYADKIVMTDEDGISAEIKYKFDEYSKNFEKMAENIKSQFKKSGKSDFLVEKVNIHIDKIPFLPLSKLNELRRILISELEKERIKSIQLIKTKGFADEIRKQKKSENEADKTTKLDYRANILNKYAKSFYESCGYEIEEMALESGKPSKKGKVAMTCKHCLKHAFDMCKSSKKLFLQDEKGKRYELEFDCKNCEMKIIY